MTFVLKPGELTFDDLHHLHQKDLTLSLDASAEAAINASEALIHDVIKHDKTVYGINTGFGALAKTRIPTNDLALLQERLILSHAAGTGECLKNDIVRLILILKINSLARGYSGVRLALIDALIKLFNAKLYPVIPCHGSVGASGDLSPLAHLAAVLLGEGQVKDGEKLLSATDALKKIGLKPLKLNPKEGLALINGTQVSTALALNALFNTETIFTSAIIAGALSTDAARGSDHPFDARIQTIRGHAGQERVADFLRSLLKGSEIRASHTACNKVQDPYSLRCQPQVMGACLTQMNYAKSVLLTEANAVSDNPLVFADDAEILSGGNFHAEPVGFAADALAVSIAEIGALSERRIALLIDPHFSELPAFLVKNPGINSGFMSAQVTAAALASANKSLAHPASVDSLPTSANQEDHVSMATYAGWRLAQMTDNTAGIVAIELLAACQGIDFLRPLNTSNLLEAVHQLVRQAVAFYGEDRFFAPDIAKVKTLVQMGKFSDVVNLNLTL